MKTFEQIYKIAKPYTITSEARMKRLYDSVVYINEKNIQGSFVECGVYKGGSVMNMALTQLNYPARINHIYLYDTFSGMTEPTWEDVSHDGKTAAQILKNPTKKSVCDLNTVKKNLSLTNYPEGFLHFVEGDVRKTLNDNVPAQISLLRIDVDWHDLTKIVLEKLYPNLVKGGVLILDDYGYWKGSKKATDEYFSGKDIKFEPIDKGVGAVYLIKNE